MTFERYWKKISSKMSHDEVTLTNDQFEKLQKTAYDAGVEQERNSVSVFSKLLVEEPQHVVRDNC